MSEAKKADTGGNARNAAELAAMVAETKRQGAGLKAYAAERWRQEHDQRVDRVAMAMKRHQEQLAEITQQSRDMHLGHVWSRERQAELEIAKLKEQNSKLAAETAQKEVAWQQQAEAYQKQMKEAAGSVGKVQGLEKERNQLFEERNDLNLANAELKRKQDLAYLSDRVCAPASQLLLRDPTFEAQFKPAEPQEAFILSIDIRRSTDLMLHAATSQGYAEFIDSLCAELMGAIKSNYGVIDKFTGDGLLAYFPLFFSGPDAGYRALEAAHQCHQIFDTHYKRSRGYFTVVRADAGLGIGMDFGHVQLLRVTNELTVVGHPVVFACRLNGAPAGHTYINNLALEGIRRRGKDAGWPKFFDSKEITFESKHEGPMICHEISLLANRCSLALPTWVSKVQETSEQPESPVDGKPEDE